MSQQEEPQIDLASVFPQKGDPRRPPEWWGRGLFYAVIAVFLAVFVWNSWGKIDTIVLDVVVSVFIALAIEPLVIRLIRHGWKRGAASAVSLIGVGVIVVALMVLFGNMFVQQVISMVQSVPAYYDQITDFVSKEFDFQLPQMENLGNEVMKNLKTSWLTDVAGQAYNTTVGLFGFLFNLLTVLMVTYYVSAAGPRVRRSLCQWLGPSTQRRFLFAWTVVQDQISGFLFSRTILAAINATCTAIFLDVIHVPYWLPLALFCGLTSQFVPTIGTYLGGALPVIFAWASHGPTYAVIVVVFIVVYQQIENLILSPKISQRTMDLNPAIAFLCVLIFGSLFGALGAFLALPITASLQAIFRACTKRYDLIDSPLMNDPEPKKKSKVVEGAEAFSEHVIKPMSERMPRVAQSTGSHVPVGEELRELQEQMYRHTSEATPGDDVPTVAIPKGVISPEAKPLKGTDETEDHQHGVHGKPNRDVDAAPEAHAAPEVSQASETPEMCEATEVPKSAKTPDNPESPHRAQERAQADDNPRKKWH